MQYHIETVIDGDGEPYYQVRDEERRICAETRKLSAAEEFLRVLERDDRGAASAVVSSLLMLAAMLVAIAA